jgi:hypothetical protein
MNIAAYAKALTAAGVAGYGAFQVAAAASAATHAPITVAEWVQIGLATLAAGGFVWGVPNTPKVPTPVSQPVGSPTMGTPINAAVTYGPGVTPQVMPPSTSAPPVKAP